jgi:rhodanese-related sulfurtransferase
MIAVIGIGLGLGYNAVRPQPLPWIAAKPKPIPTLESLQTHADSTATPGANSASGTNSAPPTTSTMPAQTVPPKDATPPRQHLTGGPEKVAVGAIGSQTREIVRTEPLRSDSAEAMTAPKTTSAPKETTAASPARDAFPDIPQSEDPIRIKLGQAKGFYDRGGMLVLDARDPDDYSDGHISGAISAPTDAKMGDIEWLKATAKDPRPIMIYCSGGDCTLSVDLANELTRTGHRRVLVFEDGYPAWETAGYPIQKGTTP